MDLTPRFRRFFFGQTLNAVGIPFLFGVLVQALLAETAALAVICLLGAVLLMFLLFPFQGENRRILLLAVLGLALALLLGGAELSRQRKLDAIDGETLLCRGVVTYTSDSEYDLSVTSPFLAKVRVESENAPAMGTRVEAEMTLSSRISAARRQAGVDLAAREGDRHILGRDIWYTLVGTLRQKAVDAFGEEREAGFLRAILLGDRSALSQQDQLSFQKTSSSHLLAISGLHVSQMLGIFFTILCLFPVSRKLRSLLMLPLIVFLLFFTGGAVSVFRASLMSAFPLVGFLLHRRSEPVTALVLAATLLVIWEPSCILSASFLLSFFSTFGILVAAGPLCNWLSFKIWEQKPGRLKWLKKGSYVVLSSFVVSSASFVFTFPLMLFLFGKVQPFAPIYALVLIPLFSPCLLLGMLACASLPIPLVGEWIARTARLLAGAFLWIHDFCAAGAPPLLGFGNAAYLAALGVTGLLLFLMISRRPVYHVFYLHAGILGACLLLWLVGLR